jgi:hypothetical protein
VDRPQTAFDSFFSRFCPHFTVTAAPLVFISEFNVQMLYLPSLKNVVADFLYRPLVPLAPSGTDAAMGAADPADFEAMAAKQNRCTETHNSLGSSSLKLAFRQADAQRLVGDFSTRVLCPIVPAKF